MIRDTNIIEQNGLALLQPAWPAPVHVKAVCTTRKGGASTANYAQLNLATHVADEPNRVTQNRQLLCETLGLQQQPGWLDQIHSNTVIELPHTEGAIQADASYTTATHQVCTVMTADCLPVLITDKKGQWVAAVHAGWRGLAAKVISTTLARYPYAKEELLIWLGPAIGGQQYEVDNSVHGAFTADYASAFTVTRAGHYLFDVYEAARIECLQAGINIEQIYGGGACTYSQADLFYSYRRDGSSAGSGTGRIASLIWLTEK